jgi:O-antigen ligase
MKVSQRFALQVALLAAIPSFAITTAFLDPINWPKQIALFVAPPLVFLVTQKVREEGLVDFSNKIINSVFLLSIVGFVIVGLFSSSNLVRTLWGSFGRNNGLISQISLVGLAWLMASIVLSKQLLLALLRSIQFLMIIPASYGVIQYFDLDPIIWSTTNQVFSFFGNINFASAVFGFATFISSGLVVLERDRRFRSIAFLLACLQLVMTFLTGSLQGSIIAAFGAFACVFLYLRRRSRRLALGFLSFGVASAPLIVLGFLGLGPLGGYIEQYTFRLRAFYAQTGLLMGANNPIFGVGIDSYGDQFRSFRPERLVDLIGLDIVVNNAHSSVVQVFATTGLVGLFSLLIILVPAYFFSIKAILNSKTQEETVIVVAIFLGIFTASMLSIDNISIAVWNYLFLGLVLNPSLRGELKESISIQRRRVSMGHDFLIRISAWVAIGATFSIGWMSSYPSRELVKIFNTPAAADNAESLRQREVSLATISNNRMLRELDFRYAADGLLAIGYFPTASDVLRLGVARFPNDFTLNDYAAVVNEKHLERAGAIPYREKQVILDRRDSRIWAQLAYDYHSVGRKDDARLAYENAVKFSKYQGEEFQASLKQVAIDIQLLEMTESATTKTP